MESSLGALFFLAVVVFVGSICYRNRESLRRWLNSEDEYSDDAKLKKLQTNVKEAKKVLRKYERRLELESRIKEATEELGNMDETETGN